MARENHETMIDGHRYQMTDLPTTPGYRLFYRLAQKLIPAFSAFKDAAVSAFRKAGGNTASLLDQEIDLGLMLQAAEVLTTQLSEADLDYAVSTLKEQCQVGINGSDKTIPLVGVFEMHFSGDIGGFIKWLAWGLKVQFGNFPNAFSSLIPPDAGGVFQAVKPPSP